MEQKRKRIDWSKRRPKDEKKKPSYGGADVVTWEIVDKYRSRVPQEEIDLNKPTFNDKELIKYRTQLYKNDSIVDAFNKEYGLNIENDDPRVNEIQNGTCIGQIIPLKITSINEEGVVFDSMNHKELFVSKINLWKYPKFKEFIPTNEIPALVIEKDKKRTVVDILLPMLEQFIAPLVSDPDSQNKLDQIETVRVKNLKLVKGGFLGDAVIPNISEWLGTEYIIPAFIPGSQLTLNVENDFESWEGQDVDTFITSYDPDAKGSQLICSRKSYIKHLGNLRMRQLFSMWCDNDNKWDDYSSTLRKGVVTGVINSSKKCGVFVEYPDENITGMISMNADQLTSYPMGMEIDFKFDGFDEELEYDDTMGQYIHKDPFEIVDNVLRGVNIKPVFKLF